MSLGSKIQELRKEKGLSQEKVSEKLEVSRQAISKWELDEAMPDTDNLIKLSNLFDISLDELVGKEKDSNSESFEPIVEKKNRSSFFDINAMLLLVCIGLVIWKPIWISFIFIPICYFIYAIISKKDNA